MLLGSLNSEPEPWSRKERLRGWQFGQASAPFRQPVPVISGIDLIDARTAPPRLQQLRRAGRERLHDSIRTHSRRLPLRLCWALRPAQEHGVAADGRGPAVAAGPARAAVARTCQRKVLAGRAGVVGGGLRAARIGSGGAGVSVATNQ